MCAFAGRGATGRARNSARGPVVNPLQHGAGGVVHHDVAPREYPPRDLEEPVPAHAGAARATPGEWGDVLGRPHVVEDVRADPQGPLEPGPGADLGAAFEYDRTVPYIEHDARFHGGVAQGNRGGIAEHGAPRGERVTVTEQGAKVVREQLLERRHQVVHATEHDSRHFDRRGVGLGPVPRCPRSDSPSHPYDAARESGGAVRKRGGQAARREGRGADHGRPGDGATRGHQGDTRLGEPGEVRESEDRSRLRADERLPPLADQMRAGPQLAQRACSDERRPRGGGVRIEQVEGVGHSRCTSSFKRSARPVGITSVWPLARTTTISSRPTTATCSLSDQITERRTSSATVAFPTTTLPCASGLRMRNTASQEPMSSQPNVPATTASRLVRSNTATSTATGRTATKKPATSPAVSAGQPGLSSRA